MRFRILVLPALLALLLLAACEPDLLKPSVYQLDNANLAPLFDRSLLMSAEGDFTVGYRNYNIRADQVTLTWRASTDANFLCYRLLRGSYTVATITDKAQNSYTHTNLGANAYYDYTIATVVKTGMDLADTLTVKTASLQSPLLYWRINFNGTLTLLWQDRADIPGDFVITRDNTEIATVAENTTPGYVYSFTDAGVLPGNTYSYQITKTGLYSDSNTATATIHNLYTMNPPNLTELDQTPGETEVTLTWTENCSAETGFRIYRRLLGAPDFVLVGTLNQTNATSYTDAAGLVMGNTYEYRVSAIDANHPNDPFETVMSNTRSITLYDSQVLSWNFDSGVMPPEFTLGGDADWYLVPHTLLRGWALRSGEIAHSQSSWISTSLGVNSGSAVTVEFDYRVSSESGWDHLRFYVNGSQVESWSGNSGWQTYSHTFTHNSPTLEIKFAYTKDGSVNANLDCAFVDNISVNFVPDTTLRLAATGGAQ
ncbi:MAG: hypothetical protein K0B87_07580 [Candidatus Syntrophosphaera sp.]|nr:hypothetical protein [Candidatus Syntrophosphaera sp.]